MNWIYFGTDTSLEYCQCNHDQRNASIVYGIKPKRLIIMNTISTNLCTFGSSTMGLCETTAIERYIFSESRKFRKCNCTSVCLTASVAEWLRAWDTLTMFEATVCGRSWVQSPTGAKIVWVFHPTRWLVRFSHLNMPFLQNSEFI